MIDCRFLYEQVYATACQQRAIIEMYKNATRTQVKGIINEYSLTALDLPRAFGSGYTGVSRAFYMLNEWPVDSGPGLNDVQLNNLRQSVAALFSAWMSVKNYIQAGYYSKTCKNKLWFISVNRTTGTGVLNGILRMGNSIPPGLSDMISNIGQYKEV